MSNLPMIRGMASYGEANSPVAPRFVAKQYPSFTDLARVRKQPTPEPPIRTFQNHATINA